MTYRPAGGALHFMGALLALTTLACGPTPSDPNDKKDPGDDKNPPAVEVAISPDAASLKKGRTQQFTATVEGAEDTAVTWSVKEDDGGSITADGLYTAPMATGTFHVIATSVADAEASATVAIEVAALQLDVVPATATISSAKTMQFTANIDGEPSTEVTWSVTEDDGGTITADGLYTPPLVGEAGTFHVVVASKEDPSVAVEIPVTVTPFVVSVAPVKATLDAGSLAQFTAYIDDEATTDVTWAIVDEDGQEITTGGVIDEDGLYTAPTTPGTVHVKATSTLDTARFAVATVTVNAMAVTVSPGSATLLPGATQQFTATVSGTASTDVEWSATGGSITQDGLFTAPFVAGTYTVEAVSVLDAEVKGTATVTVQPIAITITTDTTDAIEPGDTLQLDAIVTAGRPVAWVITNEQGAEITTGGSITQDGLYTAPWTGGEYWIHAVSTDDLRSSDSVRVTVNMIAIAVSPDAPELEAGDTQQFTATVTAGRPVEWSASGGSIDQDGLFTAPWVGGEYLVHATSTDDVRSSHSVLVTVKKLALAVSPAEAAMEAGDTLQFTATITADRPVLWSASAGSIDENGLFTAPTTSGTVTITATSSDDSSVTASATVIVEEAALMVSLVAGSTSGQSGTTNATGASARFNAPSGIAQLSETELLVADEWNHCIRLVTTGGEVSRFAGTCNATSGKGTTDGAVANARFNSPHGITVTPDGTVWVSEVNNSPKFRRIRKIDGVWTVDTPALQYDSALIKLDFFYDLTHTADGKLLVINRNRSNVLKADLVSANTLAVSILAGPDETVTANRNSATNGTCSDARFSTNLRSVAALDGKVYVSDYSHHCIRMIDPDAEGGCQVTTAVGVCEQSGRQEASPATNARLTNPFGLAVGPDGRLYIAETGNNIVSVYDPGDALEDSALLRFAGTAQSGYADGDLLSEAKFAGPGNLTFADDGSLYLTERNGNRVRRIGR